MLVRGLEVGPGEGQAGYAHPRPPAHELIPGNRTGPSEPPPHPMGPVRRLQFGTLFLAEHHIHRPGHRVHLLHPGEPHHRRHHRGPRHQPRQRDLHRLDSPPFGNPHRRVHHVPVGLVVVQFIAEWRVVLVPRRRIVAPPRTLPRQQPARQRGPRDHAEPLLHAEWHHLALLFPVHQVVVVLHGHEARPSVPLRDRQHLHQLPRVHRAGPQVEHLPLAHQLVQRGERLLDRRVRVRPVDLVEVDPLHPEPPQRGLARLDDVLPGQPAPVRPRSHPHLHLGGDDRLVTRGELAHPLAGDLLAHAERIHVRRVEEVDAELDGAPEEGPGLVLFEHPRAPLPAAEAHAAERDAGDDEAAVPETGVLQVW